MKNEITYHIPNKIELNRSYMPFVLNGGLFIPTTENYTLNAIITAHIKLPDENTVTEINATVIWLTPPNAIDYPKTGIGVQFIGDNGTALKDKILMALDNTYAIGGYIFGNE